MNGQMKKTEIELQKVNCLWKLYRLNSLLNEFSDEYNSIDWPIGIKESIDLYSFKTNMLFLDDSIQNWIETISDQTYPKSKLIQS